MAIFLYFKGRYQNLITVETGTSVDNFTTTVYDLTFYGKIIGVGIIGKISNKLLISPNLNNPKQYQTLDGVRDLFDTNTSFHSYKFNTLWQKQ